MLFRARQNPNAIEATDVIVGRDWELRQPFRKTSRSECATYSMSRWGNCAPLRPWRAGPQAALRLDIRHCTGCDYTRRFYFFFFLDFFFFFFFVPILKLQRTRARCCPKVSVVEWGEITTPIRNARCRTSKSSNTLSTQNPNILVVMTRSLSAPFANSSSPAELFLACTNAQEWASRTARLVVRFGDVLSAELPKSLDRRDGIGLPLDQFWIRQLSWQGKPLTWPLLCRRVCPQMT